MLRSAPTRVHATQGDSDPVDKMIIDANVLNARAPLHAMIEGLANIPLLAQPGTRGPTARFD
jgi:hypothetical protein